MRPRTLVPLLSALLLSPWAWGQAGHEQHHAPAAKAPVAAPVEKPAARTAPAKPATTTAPPRSDTYRSAFEGYRPFNADEPALEWRAANEAVREAGGHIGILKNAQPAPAKK